LDEKLVRMKVETDLVIGDHNEYKDANTSKANEFGTLLIQKFEECLIGFIMWSHFVVINIKGL